MHVHTSRHAISTPLTDLSTQPHVHAPPNTGDDETFLCNCLWKGDQLTSWTFSILTWATGEMFSLPTVQTLRNDNTAS